MAANEPKQVKIDQYFLSEEEKRERAVYERILSYGGEVRLNRRGLESDSKAMFGIDFATLERVLRSLKSGGIPGYFLPMSS